MNNLSDNIVSFLFGITIAVLFWITFKPKYVVIKNGKDK